MRCIRSSVTHQLPLSVITRSVSSCAAQPKQTRARFLVYARNKLRNPRGFSLPGGRELEGGGNSPSPYSSPIKGEGIFLRLLRSARNDSPSRHCEEWDSSFTLGTSSAISHPAGIATPSARKDREEYHCEARPFFVIARHRVPKQFRVEALNTKH